MLQINSMTFIRVDDMNNAKFEITDFSRFGSVRYGHGFINFLTSGSFVVSFS